MQYADDGEVHIADVKTPTGIVIEFQHSGMTDKERRSREDFYKNMVWVIDAVGFAKNFHFQNWLPERSTDLTRDLVWFQLKWRPNDANDTGMFWRKSENPDCLLTGEEHGGMVMLNHDWKLREHPDLKNISHRQFHWVKPRGTWLESKVPVYLDFGDDMLWRLDIYDDRGLRAVAPVPKRKFIHDVMVETHARDIGTRWYPISPRR